MLSSFLSDVTLIEIYRLKFFFVTFLFTLSCVIKRNISYAS